MMHPDDQFLLAYADGERNPEIDEHVASCPDCAEQVRLLEAGRDALRAAPLLELPEGRRRETIAKLPDREPRWAALRARRGPALAAAAALVLVAGIVALGTLSDGGSDQEGAGGAPERSAAQDDGAGGGEAGGGSEAPAETTLESAEPGEDTPQELNKDFGEPVRTVRGPVADVLRHLQSRGIPAVRRDGSVVAAADDDDVRAALSDRADGRVAVYVR